MDTNSRINFYIKKLLQLWKKYCLLINIQSYLFFKEPIATIQCFQISWVPIAIRGANITGQVLLFLGLPWIFYFYLQCTWTNWLWKSNLFNADSYQFRSGWWFSEKLRLFYDSMISMEFFVLYLHITTFWHCLSRLCVQLLVMSLLSCDVTFLRKDDIW